jgi:heat shock protein HslJ
MLITISILISLFAVSCFLIPGVDGNPLSETSWKLISYAGKEPIPGKDMTAIFEAKEVSGSASCNHYFGSYSVAGDRVTFQGLGWTEMACLDPEGIMEQEQTIMAMLSKSVSFMIRGNSLEILTSDEELLIFEATDFGE